MNDPAFYWQSQLLLLGMHEMTTMTDIDDPFSHYQVRPPLIEDRALLSSTHLCNSCTRQLGGIHGLPFTTYNQAETGVQWESLNGTWYAARLLNEWGGGLNVINPCDNDFCIITTLIPL